MTLSNNLTKEEYIAMVAKLVDQQYGRELDNDDDEPHHLSGSPEIPTRPNPNSIINITDHKRNDIPIELLRACNFKIGNFLIKIHHNMTNEDGYACYSFKLFEESPYTYLNRPSIKTTKITPCNDSRFDGRSWLSYFGQRSFAEQMIVSELLDMIRWLQAIGKMTAFL